MNKKRLRLVSILLLGLFLVILGLKNADAECCVYSSGCVVVGAADSCTTGGTKDTLDCSAISDCDIGCCCSEYSLTKIDTRSGCNLLSSNPLAFIIKTYTVSPGGWPSSYDLENYYRANPDYLAECAQACGATLELANCQDTQCGAANSVPAGRTDGLACKCGNVNATSTNPYCCQQYDFTGDQGQCQIACGTTGTRSLEGSVFDENNNPVIGAQVTVADKITQTGADGKYSFINALTSDPGTGYVGASKESYNPNETAYDVRDANAIGVNIFLSKKTEEQPIVTENFCAGSLSICGDALNAACSCGGTAAAAGKWCCAASDGQKVFSDKIGCEAAHVSCRLCPEGEITKDCSCLNPDTNELTPYATGYCCVGTYSEEGCEEFPAIEQALCDLNKSVTIACICDGEERTAGFCCPDASWKMAESECAPLSPLSSIIFGVVVTKYSGRPIQDADVTIPSLTKSIKTDKYGTYRFTVTRGNYNVKASRYDYIESALPVNALGSSARQNFYLQEKPKVVIRGITRRADNQKPLPYVKVTILQPFVYEIISNDKGEYSVRLPQNNEYIYEAYAKDFRADRSSFTVGTSEKNIDIFLKPDLCASPKPPLGMDRGSLSYDSGKSSVKVAWDSKCKPSQYVISRCVMKEGNDESCRDFARIGGSQANITEFYDADVELGKEYCYKVDAIYTVPKNERAITANSLIGDDEDSPCIRTPPRECATSKQFCKNNIVYDCDTIKAQGYSLAGTGTECDDKTCVVSSSGILAGCFDTNACNECNYNPNPFGLFSGIPLDDQPKVAKYFDPFVTDIYKQLVLNKKCKDIPFCYIDSSATAVDMFYACPAPIADAHGNNIDSCYVYKSERACSENKCGGEKNDCKWKYTNEDLGVGVCSPIVEERQSCGLCNDMEEDGFLFGTLDVNQIFGKCDSQDKCSAFGNCYFSDLNSDGVKETCLGGEGMTCNDYQGDNNDCGTVSAEIDVVWQGQYGVDAARVNGTNIANPKSNDLLNLGLCRWTNDHCIKDADGNGADDYADYSGGYGISNILTDVEHPFTSAIPLRGYNKYMTETILLEEDEPMTIEGIEMTVFDKKGNQDRDKLYVSCEKEENLIDGSGNVNPIYPSYQLSGTLTEDGNMKFYTQISDCIKDQANPDGKYILTYYAEDKAKNLEPVKTESFMVDSAINVDVSVAKKIVDGYVNLEIKLSSDEDVSCEAGLRKISEEADEIEIPSLSDVTEQNRKLRVNDILKNEFQKEWIRYYDKDSNMDGDGLYVYQWICEDTFGNLDENAMYIYYTVDPSFENPQPNMPVAATTAALSIETLMDATCVWHDSTTEPIALDADLNLVYEQLYSNVQNRMTSFGPGVVGNPSAINYYYHKSEPMALAMDGLTYKQFMFEILCDSELGVKKGRIMFPVDLQAPVSTAKENNEEDDFNFDIYYGPSANRDKIIFSCDDIYKTCENTPGALAKDCAFGPKKIEYFVGTNYGESITYNPKYTHTIDVNKGSVQICAKCSDGEEDTSEASGFKLHNAGVKTCYNLKIDNTPPKVKIVAPTNNYSRTDIALLKINYSDETGIARLELSIDGERPEIVEPAVPQARTGQYTHPGIALLLEEPIVVEVEAFDLAGNSAMAVTTLVFDNTPPAVQKVIITNHEGAIVDRDISPADVEYSQRFGVGIKVSTGEWSAKPVIVNYTIIGLGGPVPALAGIMRKLTTAQGATYMVFGADIVPELGAKGIYNLRPGRYFANVTIVDEAGNQINVAKKFDIVQKTPLAININFSPQYTNNLTQVNALAITNSSAECQITYQLQTGEIKKETMPLEASAEGASGFNHVFVMHDLVEGENDVIVECTNAATNEIGLYGGVIIGDTTAPTYSLASSQGVLISPETERQASKDLINYFKEKIDFEDVRDQYWLVFKETQTQLIANSSEKVICKYTLNESIINSYENMEKVFDPSTKMGLNYKAYSKAEPLKDLTMHTFYVSCSDLAGNIGAVKKIQIMAEITPTVKIFDTWPQKAAPIKLYDLETPDGPVTVNGIPLRLRTYDEAICYVINQDLASAATYGGSGAFREYDEQITATKGILYSTDPESLFEGQMYTVPVVCEDAAGLQLEPGNHTFNFIVDSYPPGIIIEEDLPLETTSSLLPIKLSITEPATVSIFVNGQLLVNKSVNAGSFSTDAYLVEGYNYVKISAVDEAGNVNEINRLVYFKNNGPRVRKIIPDTGVFNQLSNITALLTKKLNDISLDATTLEITDSQGQIIPAENYEIIKTTNKLEVFYGSSLAQQSLPVGEYFIKVVPVDVLGNVGEIGWARFVVDSNAPIINFIAPGDESYIGTDSINLVAEITTSGEQAISNLFYSLNGEDVKTISLRQAGVAAYSKQKYLINISAKNLPEGLNKLSIGAVTNAGNLALTKSAYVVVDLQGPLSVVAIEGARKATTKTSYTQLAQPSTLLIENDVGIYSYLGSYKIESAGYRKLPVTKDGMKSVIVAEYDGGTMAYVYEYEDSQYARDAASELKLDVEASLTESLIRGQYLFMTGTSSSSIYAFWPSSKYLIVLENKQPRGTKERQLVLRLASVYNVKHPSDINSIGNFEDSKFVGIVESTRYDESQTIAVNKIQTSG